MNPLLFILLFTDCVEESGSQPGLTVSTSRGKENIKGQCFVEDTILMEDITGQIEGFNTQAAIWGSVLNLSKTKVISNKSLKGIEKWTDELGITQEQHTVAKYLGVWVSVKNLTCNKKSTGS